MATVAQITITLDDSGQINVAGSIDNPIAAYGLLEIAKDSIKAHHAAQQAIVKPPTAAERLQIVGR